MNTIPEKPKQNHNLPADELKLPIMVVDDQKPLALRGGIAQRRNSIARMIKQGEMSEAEASCAKDGVKMLSYWGKCPSCGYQDLQGFNVDLLSHLEGMKCRADEGRSGQKDCSCEADTQTGGEGVNVCAPAPICNKSTHLQNFFPDSSNSANSNALQPTDHLPHNSDIPVTRSNATPSKALEELLESAEMIGANPDTLIRRKLREILARMDGYVTTTNLEATEAVKELFDLFAPPEEKQSILESSKSKDPADVLVYRVAKSLPNNRFALEPVEDGTPLPDPQPILRLKYSQRARIGQVVWVRPEDDAKLFYSLFGTYNRYGERLDK
jgi:hypothetical protein